MNKQNKKSNAGRKWFDGKDEKEVLTKLEEVWSIGGSDAEASLYANISTASLSRYLTANISISERKQALKNRPILKARGEVVKGLDNNPEFSLKYLERVKSDEFGTRQNIEHSGSIKQERETFDNLSEEQKKAEIEAIVKRLKNESK